MNGFGKRSRWVVVGVVALTTVTVGAVMGRVDAKTLDRVRADRALEARAIARSDAASKERKASQESIDVIEQRVAAASVGDEPLLKRANKLRGQESMARTRVLTLESEVDALVKVPNVSGDSQAIAQAEIQSRGLDWNIVEIEGTCADYTGHFRDRGLGWYDIVKQSPSPDTRVTDDATVDIYIWDFSSNWEFGCN